MTNLINQIGDIGVIPVVKIEDARQAIRLGQALIDGGLPCAEITFRTSEAQEAIALLSGHFPNLLLGAGTVLSIEQARNAVKSGARFIVSPGFEPKVVDWCIENNVLVIPGIATPTEINMGLERNLKVLKYFPADILGGPAGIKAIGAAYIDMKFIPTGGVSASNLASYLSLPMVHACGGSWMVKAEQIKAGSFSVITNLAIEACNIVRQVRKGE